MPKVSSSHNTLRTFRPGAVVATVHTPEGLKAASKLKPGAIDYVEVRLDALAGQARLPESLAKISIPLLLTCRDPKEGGIGSLSLATRRSQLEALIPLASLIDIEERNLARFSELIQAAHAAGCGVVASYHDFTKTPTLEAIWQRLDSAIAHGADAFKVATRTTSPSELATLLQLLSIRSKYPVSAMGMGPLGKVSRVTLAAAGSVLNYGFLHTSAADGQWPAQELAKRIAEVIP